MTAARVLFLLLIAGMIAGPGCGLLRREAKETATPLGPERIGTIAMVNEEVGFVLIDLEVMFPPESGLALKSFSPEAQAGERGETGVLMVSPERRRPFAVADIASGNPQKGDVVFR